MSEPTLSSEMLARLAQLSPERRALVERKLREASLAAVSSEGGPTSVAEQILPRAPGAEIPLTPGQELLYELEHAVANVVAYNVPRVLRVRGNFDLSAWQRALDALVVRHEALRTRFVDTPAGARQVVATPEPVPVAVRDLRSMAGAGGDDEAGRIVVDATRQHFNLAREQLLRSTLVRLAGDEWLVLIVTHHIVCDQESRNVTLRELSQLYADFASGRASTLAPLPVQYGDYAIWQRDAMAKGELAAQLEYWREELAALPMLDLPSDRPRTATPSFAGA